MSCNYNLFKESGITKIKKKKHNKLTKIKFLRIIFEFCDKEEDEMGNQHFSKVSFFKKNMALNGSFEILTRKF